MDTDNVLWIGRRATWFVASGTRKGAGYAVTVAGPRFRGVGVKVWRNAWAVCTCDGFRFHRTACRHIVAVQEKEGRAQ